MSKIVKIKEVNDYIKAIGGTVSKHPLVGVVDFSELSSVPHSLNNYEVYGVFMHQHLSVDLTYGCGKYDYQNGGTIICVAPGQIGGKEDNGERIQLEGWALLFQPSLLTKTLLDNKMSQYTFFDYSINEALHTTPEEYQMLEEIMKHIKKEINGHRDNSQDTIITDYISLLLSYCNRFYNRQFVTRKIENADILHKFQLILDDYYKRKKQIQLGLPSVRYCADLLCLSPGYLGDLVRKHTGDSAIDFIHQFILQKAKSELLSGKRISQTSYELGFDYPGHFSRLFKKIEGISPSSYIKQAEEDKRC